MANSYTSAATFIPVNDEKKTKALLDIIIETCSVLRSSIPGEKDGPTEVDYEIFVQKTKEAGLNLEEIVEKDNLRKYVKNLSYDISAYSISSELTDMVTVTDDGLSIRSEYFNASIWEAVGSLLILLEPVGTQWKVPFSYNYDRLRYDEFGGGITVIEHYESGPTAESWDISKIYDAFKVLREGRVNS